MEQMKSGETLGRYTTVLRPGVGGLASIDAPQVQALLKAGRAILFRGFGFDAEAVRTVALRFASRFHVDTGKSKENDPSPFDPGRPFLQRILPRGHAQALHCENGRSVSPPVLLWFWCERPAAEGGATTICDGVRLWEALSPQTQRLFQRERVAYGAGGAVPTQAMLAQLQQSYLAKDFAIEQLRGQIFRFFDDDTAIVEYATSAVHRSHFSELPAFTNSITGPYRGTVRLESTGDIPHAVMEEITSAQEALTDEIPWETGDLLMLDNSRFTHGRRGFSDLERKVYSMMGDPSFA